MENFIVRINRQDDVQDVVAGIVEVVGTQEEKPFKTHEELLAILSMAKAGTMIVCRKRNDQLTNCRTD